MFAVRIKIFKNNIYVYYIIETDSLVIIHYNLYEINMLQ